MNLCRLEILAQWLEKGAPSAKGVDNFNMCTFFMEDGQNEGLNVCGTVACLAGTAVTWWGDLNKSLNTSRRDWKEFEQQGAEILGISQEDADKLFLPYNIDMLRIISKQAARVVRHFMKTGEVDWKKRYARKKKVAE